MKNHIILLATLCVATLCPRGALGQWEAEARLAPHTPKEFSEGHGESFRNVGEAWFRLPSLRGFRGETGAFRTGDSFVAVFGVEKELAHDQLLPGIFAWVDSGGIRPAAGISWARHSRVALEGHAIMASPKKLLGRSDASLSLTRGFALGVTAELDPAPHGRAWGLGPHVKKQIKGAELVLGHLWKIEGEGAERHGEPSTHPMNREWFVGIKFALGHPKAEGKKSHH